MKWRSAPCRRWAKNPNHILIAGVDGTPDALQMLKSGKMIATIFQDAKGQGEGAVDAAIKLANGEKVEKNHRRAVSADHQREHG